MRIGPLLEDDIEAGFIEQRELASASEPGRSYRMLLSPGGKWHHGELDCWPWLRSGAAGDCRHVRELEMTTDQDQAVQTRAVRIFDAMDDRAIVKHIEGQATGAWIYAFKSGDQTVVGLSVDGVQEMVRRMTTTGEVIRELECVLEYEDADEARFKAKAGRYLVNAQGEEILMDTAIRGKRQPKFMTLRNGQIRADEHWYEKGIAKAVRNAAEALIPESAKDQIIADAQASGRVAQPPQRRGPGPVPPRAAPTGAPPSNGGSRPPSAASGPVSPAAAEVMKAINAARAEWDGESFAAFLTRAREQFPDAFMPNGNPAPARLSAEALAPFAAYIQREVYGDGPGEDDDPSEGAPEE